MKLLVTSSTTLSSHSTHVKSQVTLRTADSQFIHFDDHTAEHVLRTIIEAHSEGSARAPDGEQGVLLPDRIHNFESVKVPVKQFELGFVDCLVHFPAELLFVRTTFKFFFGIIRREANCASGGGGWVVWRFATYSLRLH